MDMYRRLSFVMFPVLLIAVIGTGVWGYLEHQEKNSVLIKAENQYQRAFHDLSYHVDRLHTELGQTLAVNSSSQDAYKRGLLNIWRITSQAQSEISQLPLALLPFNETESFLADVSEYSYQAAVRDMTKEPLSEKELKSLNDLYERSKSMASDLRGLQTKVLSENLRWMEVELALASKNEPHDNVIIDGFKTMNKKVSEYSELDLSPTKMAMFNKHDPSILSGEELTAEQIKQKAAEFTGINDTAAIEVTANGKGTEYDSYSVMIQASDQREPMYMDFTKRGGYLLWLSAPRDITEKKLTVRQARDAAAQFLDEHGYGDMTAIAYDQYNHTANITFASRMKDDVINMIEKVAVTVALDNGEITGLSATDYIFSNKDRQLPAPKLTVQEAKKAVNPGFKVQDVSKALIQNELNKEVLCYQITGTNNGSTYRVFVNAETGIEEKIDTVRPMDVEAGK